MIYPCLFSQIELLKLIRSCIVTVQSDTCMRLVEGGFPGIPIRKRGRGENQDGVFSTNNRDLIALLIRLYNLK